MLVTENTANFIHLILSFPVAIYSGALSLCVLFWLVAILGAADVDSLDLDTEGGVEGIAGLLVKLGLNGVPLTIVLTLVSLCGWLISVLISAPLYSILQVPLLGVLVGCGIFFGSLLVSVYLTNLFIKPLKKVFQSMDAANHKVIEERHAKVRSSVVDQEQGEVIVEIDGAELIVKARAVAEKRFVKGERVLVLEKMDDLDVYLVDSID